MPTNAELRAEIARMSSDLCDMRRTVREAEIKLKERTTQFEKELDRALKDARGAHGTATLCQQALAAMERERDIWKGIAERFLPWEKAVDVPGPESPHA